MAGVVLKQFEVSEFASVVVNDDVPIVVSKFGGQRLKG